MNKTNFHIKDFAQGVALKQRRKVTRKSPIDLDVLRAQRIMGPLLNYPQITEVGKPDHMENKLVKVMNNITYTSQRKVY